MVPTMNDHSRVAETVEAAAPSPPPAATAESPGRRWIVSIFGDITRTGSWPPHRSTSPFALFGDIDLDLRQAAMPQGEVMINAIAPFGNIDVVVPAGTKVDIGGFTVFGSKKVNVADGGGDGPAAAVRVRGFTLFGHLKVWSP
jgi:Cell wall-active antibiotics response 4TMS YvqF